jgi:hypothetical protein
VDGVIVNSSDEADWLSSLFSILNSDKANDR